MASMGSSNLTGSTMTIWQQLVSKHRFFMVMAKLVAEKHGEQHFDEFPVPIYRIALASCYIRLIEFFYRDVVH